MKSGSRGINTRSTRRNTICWNVSNSRSICSERTHEVERPTKTESTRADMTFITGGISMLKSMAGASRSPSVVGSIWSEGMSW